MKELITLVLLVPFAVLLTTVSAFLFYTFDDSLAVVLNNPQIGEVSFWSVWGFTLFFGFLMSRAGSK